MSKMTAGEFARKVRKQKRLTLEDVATSIGTDAGNLSRVERGAHSFTYEKWALLANALGMTIGELFYFAEQGAKGYDAESKVRKWPSDRTPLIGYKSAEGWKELSLEDRLDLVKSWVPRPPEANDDVFALAIKDDSMLSPNPAERSYPPGSYVFCDPRLEPSPGRRVLARVSGSATPVVRKMIDDAGDLLLVSINPAYQTRSRVEDTTVIGTIIGTYWPE